MKQRVKLIVMVVLLAVSSAALAMSLGLFKAEAAQAATCDVPSGFYPTIQSAVNDINCDNINLSAAKYIENVIIDRSVIIQGQGAESTTVDGNASGSVFAIQSGLAVTITDMTITKGYASSGSGLYNEASNLALDSVTVADNTTTDKSSGGGGIYNENGEVRISNTVISGNSAVYGGGIYNKGAITITNSTISGNSAEINGGGIINLSILTVASSIFDGNSSEYTGGGISNYGMATISSVTFDGNSAYSRGGGIESRGTITITNSGFSGNSAGDGGGIENSGTITIANSTFSGNSASHEGGGLDNSGPTASISNVTLSGNSAHVGGGIYGEVRISIADTIIANSPDGGNCRGGITSVGYNLASDGSCNLTATGDRSNTNPRLGPLKGSPGYHPLLVGSPAINAGNPGGCRDHLGNLLITDQIGQPRVGRCDIGAYEYQGVVHKTSLPVTFLDFCSDLFDDFNNTTSGWGAVDNDFVLAEYLNGEYRILSTQSGFFNLFHSPSCDRESYVVEADARWVGPPGTSYGLIFGITDGFSNFYLFDINTDFREFRLLRFGPGGLATIVPGTFSPAILGGNATNHLKVTRNGAQITLGINGADLGAWSDGNITGLTGAGLVSSHYNDNPTADARFDNFSITLSDANAVESADSSVRATSRADISREYHIALPIGDPWYPRD